MEDMMKKLLKAVEATNSGVTTMKITTRSGKLLSVPSVGKAVIENMGEEDVELEKTHPVDELEKSKKEKKAVVTTFSKPPPPFLHRLKKKTNETKFSKFIAMLTQLTVNVPLVEALEQIARYAKFMKDLLMKKRIVSYELMDNLNHCGAISIRSLVQKKANPGAFTIPCTIRSLDFSKALCDLGASINLMPLAVYKKMGLGDPTPTNIRLVMTDRHNNEVVRFDVCQSIKQRKKINVFSIVDVYYEDEQEDPIEEKFELSP
ncbi:uncharacterized protein LOC107869163 [Capsicum annuum]|uniref:uncharacterized protein LOC107869163 n=1 Tax=Capsicum annuum TaxID=4072 RepID=UPI0007BEFBD3|nr:uncharacterized protein LOC107869163 [Capsicum annuum]